MNKNYLNKIFAFTLSLLCSIGVTGCSMFSSNSYTPPADDNNLDFDDPTAIISKDSGSFVRPEEAKTVLATLRKALVASGTKNISIELPSTVSSDARYSVIVHNSGSASQYVKIYYETAGANASVRDADNLEFYAPEQSYNYSNIRNTKWGNLEAKEELKKNLRNNMFYNSPSGNIRGSLRANHSDETIGQQYEIKIVNNTSGTSYSTFNFTLRHISEHAKFFVDSDNSSITDEDINHFADEYENRIYQLLIGQYGEFLDIDGDGKLSIVFSNQYKSLGFAGLFNSADLIPESSGGNGNNRDMIGVWTPGYRSGYQGEYWRAATRETIAHEMQHAINFSAKLIKRGYTTSEQIAQDISVLGNTDALMETEWIDEGISVCTEARYRQIRGNAGLHTINNYDGETNELDSVYNDSRFGSWLINSNVSLTSWRSNLPNYGQKGLFFWYLFEQKGSEFIKQITQSKDGGESNLRSLVDFQTAMLNFEQAVLNEVLHFRGIADKSNVTDSKLKFTADVFPATLANSQNDYTLTTDITLGGGSQAVSVAPNNATYFTITQPASFSGNTSFRIAHSSNNSAIIVTVEKVK